MISCILQTRFFFLILIILIFGLLSTVSHANTHLWKKKNVYLTIYEIYIIFSDIFIIIFHILLTCEVIIINIFYYFMVF